MRASASRVLFVCRHLHHTHCSGLSSTPISLLSAQFSCKGRTRGLGLLDLAYAVREGRLPRASGEMAYHVLEAMEGIAQAPRCGGFVRLQSTCIVPPLLPEEFPAQTTKEPAHAS